MLFFAECPFVLCVLMGILRQQASKAGGRTHNGIYAFCGIGPLSMHKTLFKEKLQWSKLHVPQQPDQPSSDTPSPPDPVNYSSTLANERVEDQALIKAIK